MEETYEADKRATPRFLQELQKVQDSSGTFLTARTMELRTFGDLNLDAFSVSDTSPSPQPTVALAIDRSRRSKALGNVVEDLGLRSYQLPDELILHIKHLRIKSNRLAQIAVALDRVPDLTKINFLEERLWATISHDTLPDWDGMLLPLLSKLKDLLVERDSESALDCSRTIKHQERLHQESKEIILDLRSIITRDAV
ncbi:hypothetical protein M427DRAFT_263762 [Gonapodya prolifera JEL478]|uniref:Uncharacterized protein n=1 Tax=Gonapodya prolifera (strain JEL478) TaxID=1344416 RepID=A0A139AKT9_GONPJ|nr:hypothetical protein M427DRAFT_263762 [Gonapodya prolifera JEL478]|eukprot:KXS17113.1 hypothetical protein M427DRAFT_263762 [Gonapodya prolifera JEL478]